MRGRVAERYLVGPVYETLLTTDPSGRELRARLAEAWSSDLAGTVHLFRLREGVTFHDGTPLTADDVVATLAAVRSGMNVTTAARARLGPIERVRAVDPLTVEVRWEQPTVAGFRALGLTIPILPAHALKEGFNTAAILNRPIGTGPFRVTGWEAGEALTMERYADHWDGPAWLDRVVLRWVPDDREAARLFAEGAFDVMTGISPATWKAMETESWSHAYRRTRVIENTPQMLVWNQVHPALADARVRRALALLQPDETVRASVEGGLSVSTRCPFHPGSPACEDRQSPPPPDAEAAQALLAEAGWVDADGDGMREKGGETLLIRLAFGADSTVSGALVRELAPVWKEAGVVLEPQPLGWSELLSHLRAGDFDAVAMAWPMTDVEAPLLPLVHGENPAGINYGGHADPELDLLLAQRDAAFSPVERDTLARAIRDRLELNPPFLVVSFRPRLEAVKREVRGWTDTPAWPLLQRLWREQAPEQEATAETGALQ